MLPEAVKGSFGEFLFPSSGALPHAQLPYFAARIYKTRSGAVEIYLIRQISLNPLKKSSKNGIIKEY
ncbi:MAG TPA: hypothetical protein DCZ62_09390 [Ruminococcus sp.]|nr:hypothetical protein [Ruminococcus sp.]